MAHLSVHMRGIVFALGGFSLWVLADTCMKLAGEATLPPYEVVGFLGLAASLSLGGWFVIRGKGRELWPKKPLPQIGRSLLAVGCLMCNAVALKHLPLTMFYMVVFMSPIAVVLLAAVFLREGISWQKGVAILAGFAGVVIAIDPWGSLSQGDWVGYLAGAGSVLAFALSTIYLRFSKGTETVFSMMFVTALTEMVVGFFCCMVGDAVAVAPMLWLVLGLMGMLNVAGNMCNAMALQLTNVAVVEQFHYTQIVMGALLGYFIWHEVPSVAMIAGTAVIVASGLYIVAHMQSTEKAETRKRAASAPG